MISNTGNSTLNVRSLSLPYGFYTAYTTGSFPAGSSVNIDIYFAPYTAGYYGGNIVVNSDATEGISSISASGSGINGSTSNFTAVPAIGNYSNCAIAGKKPNCSTFSDGVISAKFNTINPANHTISITIKKCDNSNFNGAGTLYVTTGLCSGTSYVSGSFQAGNASVNISFTDNNMTGTKKYYVYIVQGTQSNIYYATSSLVVTY